MYICRTFKHVGILEPDAAIRFEYFGVATVVDFRKWRVTVVEARRGCNCMPVSSLDTSEQHSQGLQGCRSLDSKTACKTTVLQNYYVDVSLLLPAYNRMLFVM